MQKVYSLVVGVILASAVSGCAKSDDNRNNPTVTPQTEKPMVVDLSGKSLDEVLKIKYNKAELKCALWTQRSQQLDITGSPTDSVSLDLKSNPTVPATLTLKGQIQDHGTEIQLAVSSLAMWGTLHHTDTEGTVYLASYTPYAKIDYTLTSSTVFGVGQSSSGNGFGSRSVNEKIVDMTLNQSVSSAPTAENGVVLNQGAFRDYVQCVIETDIKPEYQDQFKVQPRK